METPSEEDHNSTGEPVLDWESAIKTVCFEFSLLQTETGTANNTIASILGFIVAGTGIIVQMNNIHGVSKLAFVGFAMASIFSLVLAIIPRGRGRKSRLASLQQIRTNPEEFHDYKLEQIGHVEKIIMRKYGFVRCGFVCASLAMFVLAIRH